METVTKTRRVIKSGESLIISLPKEFVDAIGLKKGDTVGLIYDSILVIVTPKLPEGEVEEKGGQDTVDKKINVDI